MKSTVISTNGKGHWTQAAKLVTVTNMDLNGYELRVHMLPGEWNRADGLIYSDPGFIKGLREHLVGMGMPKIAAQDVDYSEHGMQGRDYVSFDVGKEFIKAWAKV